MNAKNLSTEQVLFIFRKYRDNLNRTFEPQDITFIVGGTLIILISCLFMNGGAGEKIDDFDKNSSPNNIVMNTVIASATAGLTMMTINQYNNVF